MVSLAVYISWCVFWYYSSYCILTDCHSNTFWAPTTPVCCWFIVISCFTDVGNPTHSRALARVVSVLATISNSPITLDMLTIPIHLGGEEDNDDSEESEDDTSHVPRILLNLLSAEDLSMSSSEHLIPDQAFPNSILSHDTSCSTFRPPLQFFTRI